MTDESLSKAMMTLNLDWGTDMKESIPLIHPLAFNGNTAEGKYRFLYTLCTDGGGNDWHLWAHKNNDDDSSCTRNGEIVFIGHDGEKCKVATSLKDFLQVVCAMRGGITDASSEVALDNQDGDEINRDEFLSKWETNYGEDNGGEASSEFPSKTLGSADSSDSDSDPDTDDYSEPTPKDRALAANLVLSRLKLREISVEDAFDKMVAANRTNPRFDF